VSLVTPESIRKLQKKLYVKAKKEPEFRFYQLYDKVWREDILEYAYRVSRAAGGGPGVDGVTFAQIEAGGLESWLGELQRELRTKTYRPSPVLRRQIPKPGGGRRPLGIPTIRDRVVQTAAKLVLEPIFEADFEDSAYGYRPQRSAQEAVQKVHRLLCEGYHQVVDADVSKYFDEIPHADLMQSVARRVVDRAMLKLIKSWLKAPVQEENGGMSGGRKSRVGTPQGGVISPLLANIYMHRYLRAWRQQGKGHSYQAHIVNYADDFVILSRGNAEPALKWTKGAMKRMGLRLNLEKTAVRDARQEPFDFLGYTFGPERYRGDGHWYLSAKPSRQSVQRVKRRLRACLRPGQMAPWGEVVIQLNRVLRGWSNYFNYGTRLMAYRAVDNYVLERAAHFLRRRHKVRGRGSKRFSDQEIFGSLGVLRLRTVHLGPPSTAET
jgi:RNA-directed DNA polymerase